MEQFFTDNDLLGLLEELEEDEAADDEIVEEEMEASSRRYREIIQKHKME